MIKLTKWEDEVLSKFSVDSNIGKLQVIGFFYSGEGTLPKTFKTSKSRLKATQAILDGKWEVEEPLYYVKLIDSDDGYLNINKNTGLKELDIYHESTAYKTKFTRAEIKAIDPRYLEFLEEVK
ncbi:DUF1642 domain-containing protein [Streptococcus parauberis]|uniref:DUF1642 domain-containing protein n=1 Tax=Streptococcus parauberis TaxID=1348 RepID=UPI00030D45ED|nr:DUF1642 domain-containing protein [Streptococcus parauberis]QBX17884.1 hypothetical protein Javan383_0039 [Streptococcus phage Javan383]UWM90207.1 DUF1642 domain-containing protein [Streptococcus parauberis]